MMTESGADGCCVIVSPNTIRNCTHNVSQIRIPLRELTKDSTNRHANVNGENSWDWTPTQRTKGNWEILTVGEMVFSREEHSNSYPVPMGSPET